MRRIVFFISILNLTACNAQPEVIFEENFDGNSLNLTHWNYELGDGCPALCGWGNDELQLYTKENVVVRDGNLVITASKKDGLHYSGRITTKDKVEFTYGTIEVRAKLATGKGLWPAFWMLGSNIDEAIWPACGEIDIMEYVGREPHVVFTSLHTTSSSGETVNTKRTRIENIEEGFHTYKAEWTKDHITFFVDNTEVYTYNPALKNVENWPFDQPFYLLANLAIGGKFGGREVDQTIFPEEYLIDYIKITKP